MNSGPQAEPGNRPIALPATLSSHPKDKPRLGLAFTHEGMSWTVTDTGWRAGIVRYWLTEFADGSGERREVTADELGAMLNA